MDYFKKMSECYQIGMMGDCNTDCPVLLRGDCPNPDEMLPAGEREGVMGEAISAKFVHKTLRRLRDRIESEMKISHDGAYDAGWDDGINKSCIYVDHLIESIREVYFPSEDQPTTQEGGE